MARNAKADRAKLKAKREKKLAIVLGIVFVIVLAISVPKTLKSLHPHASTPVASGPVTTTTDANGTPIAVTTPVATPTPAASSQLVSAVQVTADPGQLTQFELFASKDPFAQQVVTTESSTPSTPSKTPTPPSPPPTSAVISLNGELMSVNVDTDFPTSGSVFDRVGSLFHLVSLTKTSATVSIVGGSYSDGSATLKLTVGKPVTLQNTADGTRYTLILEPQGTQLPTTTTTAASTTPTSTTPTPPVSGSGN